MMNRRSFVACLASLPFIGKLFGSETVEPLNCPTVLPLKVVKYTIETSSKMMGNAPGVGIKFNCLLSDGTTRDGEFIVAKNGNGSIVKMMEEIVMVLKQSYSLAGIEG